VATRGKRSAPSRTEENPGEAKTQESVGRAGAVTRARFGRSRASNEPLKAGAVASNRGGSNDRRGGAGREATGGARMALEGETP